MSSIWFIKGWDIENNHAVEPPSIVNIVPVVRSDFSSKRCNTVEATCSVSGKPRGARRLIDSNFSFFVYFRDGTHVEQYVDEIGVL